MKPIKIILSGFYMLVILQMYSCKKFLEPKIYSETTPENLFKSLKGVESVLFGAYAKLAEMPGSNIAVIVTMLEENMGDIIHSNNADVVNFKRYIIDPATPGHWDKLWLLPFEGIRNANIILENIDGAEIDNSAKTMIRAEAQFIRAVCYFKLYMRYGPVPLRTNTLQELELPRASEAEMTGFIETELKAATEGLPIPGQEPSYGRAHKGAALGYLMKLSLAGKQWQKVTDYSKQIMDLNVFGLFPNYFTLFFVANEGNEELIWIRPAKADLNRTAANTFMNIAYPPSFKQHPASGLEFPAGASIFSGGLYMYDAAYNSFPTGDKRKDLIITEYINQAGQLVSLTVNPNTRAVFKYWPDADYIGPAYGNDIPEIRYADVLLSRAEALNELNGATQEALDLINEVRTRAGVPDLILTDFPSKESLREHLLNERGWEFYLEGQRRHDLIRHGKLIERALLRGLPAKPHHVRLPIPTFALEANPKLVQNDGYN
jgi:hypothetical protein